MIEIKGKFDYGDKLPGWSQVKDLEGGSGLRNKVYLKKGWCQDSIDLLEGMLEYDPDKRWGW